MNPPASTTPRTHAHTAPKHPNLTHESGIHKTPVRSPQVHLKHRRGSKRLTYKASISCLQNQKAAPHTSEDNAHIPLLIWRGNLPCRKLPTMMFCKNRGYLLQAVTSNGRAKYPPQPVLYRTLLSHLHTANHTTPTYSLVHPLDQQR